MRAASIRLVWAVSWMVVGVWLQILAPPWLALTGLLWWLRKEEWWVRVAVVASTGVFWSLAGGISPVLGIGLLAVLIWLEKVTLHWLSDTRWRVLMIAGLISIIWGFMSGVIWTVGVIGWWLVQGLIARFSLRFLAGLPQGSKGSVALFREPAKKV